MAASRPRPPGAGRQAPARERLSAARNEAARALGKAAEPTGPHVRLGLAWGLGTGIALLAGPVWLALWLSVTAGLAAAQLARTWRIEPGGEPSPASSSAVRSWVAGLAGALGTFGGLSGLFGLAIVSLVVGLASVTVELATSERVPTTSVLLQHAFGIVLVGWATASLVLVRHGTHGTVAALALFAFVAFYDAGNYLLGTGAVGRWEGPVAGMASVAACTVAVAAAFESAFPGGGAWGLGVVAALTAPAGSIVATRLLGETTRRPGERAPALRRLDSLLVTGPIVALILATTIQR